MREIKILEEILQVDNLTDICITKNQIIIDKGNGLEKVKIPENFLETSEDTRDLAGYFAFQAGVRLDTTCPIADGLLPENFISKNLKNIRFHAVLAPVCSADLGAIISLRIPSKTNYSLEKLQELNMITNSDSKILEEAVKNKKNIIISGATGSGKTTLMSALIQKIPDKERVICLEESREIIKKLHPNLLFLTAKKANIEKIGKIDLNKLVSTSLRMHPNRLIIGEVRGNEVREYIQLLNTGHKGVITTIHANSCDDVPDRIASLACLSGLAKNFSAYSFDIVKNLFQKNIDLFVHLEKDNKTNTRKIVELENN
ncbi:MAG: Flp pilus assembly complex ATPase component TadA [Candidatus Ancillula sp.]|jgi:pilus assembly protein CpaF|nr:Flp pilus assembly complex ATPase component TadA [Candidatus Ancillula sp.]